MKQETKASKKHVVAALGVFDGVHLGHRRVLAQAVSIGQCHVVTFAVETMHGKQGRTLRYLYDNKQREQLLTQCGVHAVYPLSFTEMHTLDGDAFCSQLLKGRLQVDTVVCGEDFRFGRNAACNSEALVRMGQRYGFRVVLVPRLCDVDGSPVSSAKIRFLLESGQVQQANALLGSDYRMDRHVESGNQIGRTMGFPTANQPFESWQCVPCHGVYASFAQINDVCVPAITNIGTRPTVTGGSSPIAETHLLDWSGDLNGKRLCVTLHSFMRAESRFPSIDALSAQIQEDIKKRRALLHNTHEQIFE